MMRRCAFCGLLVALFASVPSWAQVAGGAIVQTRVAQDYDRGRNIAVLEQPRPDYDPLGQNIGGFILFPRMEIGAGGTSNAFLTTADNQASSFVSVTPSARLISDWSRHSLQLAATGTARDYLGNSERNERLWSVRALARVDVRRTFTVEVEANAIQAIENLFSGEVSPTAAALSRYRQNYASLRGTYTLGRGRAFVAVDYTNSYFNALPLIAGGVLDQSDRDRSVARLIGQVEYARSPSVSLFAQVSGARTKYDRLLLSGGPSFDSKAARLLTGANVDIAGRLRGTLGIGYSVRSYDASRYESAQGLSVESRIQVFPMRRLTVTVEAERTIEDASRSATSFWNTGGSVTGDYEVMRNLTLSASAEYTNQNYIRSPQYANILRGSVRSRYLASRRFNLQGLLSYSRRSSASSGFDEARAEVSISYQI